MLKIMISEFSSKRILRSAAALLKYRCRSYIVVPKLLQSNLLHSRCNRNRIATANSNVYLIISAAYHNQIRPLEAGTGDLKGKVFVEYETEYHHSVMENSSVYSSTIFKLDPNFVKKYSLNENECKNFISEEDWSSKSAYHVALAFVSLGVYSQSELKLTMEDRQFDALIDAFEGKSSSFTDDQLMDCLIGIQFWPKSDHAKAENFFKVWKALDNICYQRFSEWSLDKILFVMDLWYQIKLTRLSNFVYKGINKISRKCEDLTQAQMVQTLFYMSCVRTIHPGISIREYEHFIQKHITHLTIGEIGIFCLAFFKTKMKINNQKILLYTMQRAVEEVDTIDQVTLTAIAKAIRYSHRPEIGFTANDFVNHMVERKFDSLNLINAIHILHISTQVQFYNQEAITKLAEKFYNDPSNARLKDIERVAFVLSLFNYVPPSTPNILQTIVEELNKPHQVGASQAFSLTFLSLLYYLSILQTFPENQIRQVVDDEYLLKKYDSKYMIPVQVLQIDYNRVLEGPPGSEHLLSPSLKEYLARRHALPIPDKKNKPSKYLYDQMFVEVKELTKEVLGGEQNMLVTYTLPHTLRADFLFHLDDNGKPLPIPDEMQTRAPFVDVVRPPDAKGWFAVVLGGRNMYMHNTPKLIGEQATKLRQLQLLGYTPIMIPFHYWTKEKNKMDYLKLKFFTRTK